MALASVASRLRFDPCQLDGMVPACKNAAADARRDFLGLRKLRFRVAV